VEITVKYNLTLQPDGYWRLQVWVSECGDNDDPNIFVYQLLPDIPHKDAGEEIFVDIASRHDMEEYPVDTPANGLSFFRRSYMDISVQDPIEMQTALTNIEKDIELLTKTYEVIT
jgi:hypothetical protein